LIGAGFENPLYPPEDVIHKNRVIVVFRIVSQRGVPLVTSVETMAPGDGEIFPKGVSWVFLVCFVIVYRGKIGSEDNMDIRIQFGQIIAFVRSFPIFWNGGCRWMIRIDFDDIERLKFGMP